MKSIEVPAPTAWPLVLATGFALMGAGLLTDIVITVFGTALATAGCIGWFLEVLPSEHEAAIPVAIEEEPVFTTRRLVDRFPVAPDQVRAWLPLQTHPVSAGVKGGLAGGAAMALLACAFGVLKAGSIWYPINLLAAAVYAQSLKLAHAPLESFHPDSFAIALGLHGLISAVIGLLYGAMLPMFPRRPILLGGLIGPALWSGLLYSLLSILNPLLEKHIDWFWFVASQVAFGAVAGMVVMRTPRVPTRENVSFAMRAGIETPGIMRPPGDGESRP